MKPNYLTEKTPMLTCHLTDTNKVKISTLKPQVKKKMESQSKYQKMPRQQKRH